MPDPLKAWLRTVWPGFVGYLTALLVTWLGAKVGITVDTNVTFGAISVALLAIVYGLGRWLEGRSSPGAQQVGRWLVSLGMDLGQPTYTPRPPAPPAANQKE